MASQTFPKPLQNSPNRAQENSWPPLGPSALEASPFKTRNGGSPECEGSVAHFCLILTVLGCLLVSFWLSWDALGPHFGSLGASWGGFLAQVGPSWPKIAKKNRFFEFDLRIWDQVGTQVGTQVGPRPSKIEARTPKNQG